MQGGETMGRKSRVCYTLENSPFVLTVDGITYHFSSAYLLNNFLKKLEISRNSISVSLTNRFHFAIDARKISDVFLYSKTESRGFYIILENGEVCTCLDRVRFGGGNLTQNSFQSV